MSLKFTIKKKEFMFDACYNAQKLKLWPNSKTQIVTKLKKTQIVTKLKNSNCDKTQKLKLWQN